MPSFEELREQALTAADKKSTFNWVRLLRARELDIIHMHLLPYLLSGLRQVLLPFFSGWGGVVEGTGEWGPRAYASNIFQHHCNSLMQERWIWDDGGRNMFISI